MSFLVFFFSFPIFFFFILMYNALNSDFLNIFCNVFLSAFYAIEAKKNFSCTTLPSPEIITKERQKQGLIISLAL